LSNNPSLLEKEPRSTRWHRTLDDEVVSGWHALSYIAQMDKRFGQVMSENVEDDVDEDSNQRGPQVTTNVWKD